MCFADIKRFFLYNMKKNIKTQKNCFEDDNKSSHNAISNLNGDFIVNDVDVRIKLLFPIEKEGQTQCTYETIFGETAIDGISHENIKMCTKIYAFSGDLESGINIYLNSRHVYLQYVIPSLSKKAQCRFVSSLLDLAGLYIDVLRESNSKDRESFFLLQNVLEGVAGYTYFIRLQEFISQPQNLNHCEL